ncbi:wHTH domain-containing protein [Lentzea flava]|uniref:Histidine kinase-, DNA gyrase B-, and HSP90-like ATPase n=1 Tax=Lentzea flava TaxID=103732 RepID=A0ABQ2UM78_9PSEU|nr:hypothetical protein [Lentzea flava]MCP2204827.1 hypothetical protein [Lentzea flava]GGU44468.1 hypothetical protein GCM10010178_41130 [Lentzea flava]
MHENDPRLVIGATAPQRSLAEVTATHPWVTTAREHLGPSNSMLAATTAVISRLSDEWDDHRTALALDPWLDTAFAERFTQRLRWLTALVELRLSDAEAALLVTFPYLYQAFWTKQAATVLRGADPVAAAFTSTTALPEFSAFAAEHGTLHRRGIRAHETGNPAAESIGWWLFHRWLVQQPACYDPGYIASLLPAPPNAVLTAPRLMELMRVVQIDPAFLRRADRPGKLKPTARIAGGTEFEQDLREQLIGYLLVVAHRTAIDPTVLPRVVVDHIGIDDPVTPDEVLTSIREATWDGKRTRVLTAECRHPATALALRDRAAAVDSVLTEIVRAVEESDTLKPLKDLPVHASADDACAPVSAGHRFRLTHDRIQSLLMGEQLYGTPELAIRELYQNALDACRYRASRTAYLAATGTALPPWQGRISFRQGVDDQGRPFLDCTDNGIGMGDRELVDVFARAGVRFTDMPEYVEEQADWAAAGIESFPNSRFGIGVLSYFMLADEITVTTCRLDRSGRPGRRLQVHIAGPDALFRVQDLGPGDEAGTTVRLRLRPTANPVHCTELLRRILWVSDFHVTSDDQGGRHIWEPRQLSAAAPVGTKDALDPEAPWTADPKIVPADGGSVWWCDGQGAVLADGLWAGATMYGAVVDLAGRDQPRLTVDRKTIIDLDRAPVERLMRSATAALTSPGSPLSHKWLAHLARFMPRLADEICESAIDVRYRPWRVGAREAPIEIVGCFSSDGGKRSSDRWPPETFFSDHINRWRLAAWLCADAGQTQEARDSVVPALPSDEILLGTYQGPMTLGQIIQAALDTQRSPAEAAARLALLGCQVPGPGSLPTEVSATDPQLLRDDVDHWLSKDEPVSHRHVLSAAAATGLAPSAVVERLAELGFDTSEVGRLPAEVRADDMDLLTTKALRQPLRSGEAVLVAHIMVVAAETGRAPVAVAQRLAYLGYVTPDAATLPPDADRSDSVTFVQHQQGVLSYVRNPVRRQHVVLTAVHIGRQPAEVAARLAAAGFEISPGDDFPDRVTPSDREITLRREGPSHTASTRLHHPTAHIGHVLASALATKQSAVVVARRLAEFGYEVPPLDCLPSEVEVDDLALVSTMITDGSGSLTPEGFRVWLRTGQQVSLQHILVTAAKTALQPLAVARRLARFGFVTPPDSLLDVTVRLEDLLLLSVNLDGHPPWLDGNHRALVRGNMTVPVGHVLAAAAKLPASPANVVARLARLGLRTETSTLPARVDKHDAQLLARAIPARDWRDGQPNEFGWLGMSTPVDRQHLVVAAGRTGRPTAEIAERLSALGFAVPDTQGLPRSVDQRDLKLLSDRLYGGPPYRDLSKPFPRAQVMRAVNETGLSPRDVLDRLRRLGIELGE